MTAARFYSSTAGPINLTGSITSVDAVMTVSTTTGLPGVTPFTLVVDPGTATEEIVTVTNVSGLTLTITRGVDGSSAQSHSAGVANVRHMATARDYREPAEHVGATQDVHGIGASSSVVGTDTTQTLKNKTVQASAAGAKALIVKSTTSQTANILDVQDVAGSTLVSVKPAEGTLSVGTTVQINENGAANFFSYVQRITANVASAVGLIIRAAASQTADLFQVQNSAGTVLAKFDKDGKLTAPQVTSTGPVSGTTGTFTGQVQSNSVNVVTLSESQTLTNKSLTAPTTTGLLSGATAAFSGAVTATNLPAVGASLAGKRLHWGTYSGTTTGGEIIFNHGLPFTPTGGIPMNNGVNTNQIVTLYSITSTQARVAWRTAAGGTPADGTAFTWFVIWGE